MEYLTEKDWELIRYIQADLPEDKRPFLSLAEKLNLSEQEVLSKIRQWMEAGIIKRFGALVRHEPLGFKGNVMVAWYVPQSDVEKVGGKMAAYPFISHCYERITRPNWHYNIYTMIHGSDKGEAQQLIKKVADETGIRDYKAFYTVRQWKKKSMEYI